MTYSEAALRPYRKPEGVAFQIGRRANPFAKAVPYLKVAVAFGMGATACLLLLAVGA